MSPRSPHSPRPVRQALRPVDAAQPCCCDLSVVIPLHDEEENVGPLYHELREVFSTVTLDYEIVFVDDGSRDQTVHRLREAAAGDPRVVIVELRRNFGQTSAMAAGFDSARGRVIVPMDGDLQNDPRDIPAMIDMLEKPPGYDVVSGWRKNRRDRMLSRRIPSQIANWIIGRTTGVQLHDYGCTLKAYRREVLEDIALYSELHRFIPALAAWEGARITEMVVNHRARRAGRTKYGLKRTFHVVLDLITVKFLGSYRTKPLYFFGKLFLYTMILSLVSLGIALFQRFGYLGHPQGLHLNRNVFVLFSGLLAIFAVQCIVTGIVSEMLVRVYHESQNRPIYRIRSVWRGADQSAEQVVGPRTAS